ncbi:Derlin-1 [Thelohanellus kitauei]|uniref:Derlin n=1 Tax=Thelohanellus kitauei TaxID=669202 RepID=A0A0C2ILZ3_THEKT|nr:Derlin-1 [Thelohanellus kitauei]
MIYSVLYVWSQMNSDEMVSFWFGLTFKSKYYPWVLLLINLLMYNRWAAIFSGILVGHLYYFLTSVYPEEYNGPKLLKTPAFLYKFFPREKITAKNVEIRPGYTRFTPADRQEPQQPTFRWGRGRRLDE